MTTTKAVVLLSFCVALATATPAADTSLLSVVEQQTAAANKVLATLSASCTRGSARNIQEAKIKLFGDVASCGVAAIIKDIAYIMIDSADFGSDVWGDGVEVVTSIKACLNENTLLEKVECLDDALSNSSDAIKGINDALRKFVEQLIVIIPEVEKEIKICQGKSTHEYKQSLDSLIKKAKTC